MKELIEVLLLLGGFVMTVVGAIVSVLNGTTTVRRAKLTGDLMEQMVTNQQKSIDSLGRRLTDAESRLVETNNQLRATTLECDELREKVEQMVEQKKKDDAAIAAFVSLAKSLGASDVQIKLASIGIVVTNAELADANTATAVNLLASKIDSPKTKISE